MFGGQKLDFRRLRELRACENNGVFKYIRVAPFDLCIQHSIVQNSSCRLWRVAEVRGLNWHFESSSRYSGLSRCVPSSSHRLPRSFRRELGLFVSSPTSSSRQLHQPRLQDLLLDVFQNGGSSGEDPGQC